MYELSSECMSCQSICQVMWCEFSSRAHCTFGYSFCNCQQVVRKLLCDSVGWQH